MKFGIFIIAIFCLSNTLLGQVINCEEFKTGVFQFPGINGGVYTIIRTDTNQFERNSKQAQHAYYKIKWLNRCEYVLFDRTEFKWGEDPQIDTTKSEFHNIIYKSEKPNKYFVKTYLSNYPDTVETVITKLDTTKCYSNIFQLEEFSEYKNSKAYGQTMLGEIHSIDYYESNKTVNKYLITFETTYSGEKLDKTRLIDTTTVYLAENQNIANSNCRFNNEFDDEIVAIYISTNEEEEAKIIKAFRCNRQTEKIEPLDIKFVQYKAKDRERIKW